MGDFVMSNDRVSLTDRILQAKTVKADSAPTFRRESSFGQAGTQESVFGHDVSEEDLFNAFAGPDSEKLLETYQLQAQGTHKSKFNWAVFFFPMPWFFYRKLYLYGVLTILLPMVLVLIFPAIANASFAGVAVALGLTANGLYVYHAKRKIAKLQELGLAPDDLLDQVKKSGGTSMGAGVFSGVIYASLLVLPFLQLASPSQASLPTCKSDLVHKTVRDLLSKELIKNGFPVSAIKYSDFKHLENVSDDTRNSCSFTITDGKATATKYATIFWQDQGKGAYQLSIVEKAGALPK